MEKPSKHTDEGDIHNVDKRIVYFADQFYWSIRRLESSGFRLVCFSCQNQNHDNCLRKDCQCLCRAAEFQAKEQMYIALTGHGF